jgi:carbon storage regulator
VDNFKKRKNWMLILLRDRNEKIIIGDEVWITFLGAHGRKAKIGVSAPRELLVYREELYHHVKAKQARAGQRHEKANAR